MAQWTVGGPELKWFMFVPSLLASSSLPVVSSSDDIVVVVATTSTYSELDVLGFVTNTSVSIEVFGTYAAFLPVSFSANALVESSDLQTASDLSDVVLVTDSQVSFGEVLTFSLVPPSLIETADTVVSMQVASVSDVPTVGISTNIFADTLTTNTLVFIDVPFVFCSALINLSVIATGIGVPNPSIEVIMAYSLLLENGDSLLLESNDLLLLEV